MVEVDPDRPEKTVLDAQEQRWQATFVHKPEIFGGDPSGPAAWAAERFKREHAWACRGNAAWQVFRHYKSRPAIS